MNVTCIGEPISWPRLERFAVDGADPGIAAHVVACAACRDCLDRIRLDELVLPPLAAIAAPVVARRRRWLAPALGAVAMAAVAVVLLVRRPGEDRGFTVGVKGVGDVSFELVRERAGEISFGAKRYAPGDRWKVVVTCAPGAGLRVAVSVADGLTRDYPDHPRAGTPIDCGNRVPLGGAFTITGDRPNQICVLVVGAGGGDSREACTTVTPE